MLCVLYALGWLCDVRAVGGAAECIVVRVVVNDRTEGAGEEKVLSFPRPPVLTPHPTVAFVPPPDDAVCD